MLFSNVVVEALGAGLLVAGFLTGILVFVFAAFVFVFAAFVFVFTALLVVAFAALLVGPCDCWPCWL
jgi:hypothetical protein